MKNVYLNNAIILLTVCLLKASCPNLNGAENNDLRTTAEKFVHQICEKDTDAVLQTYPMTDEFKAIVPNAAVVTKWARGIDQSFGRLGDVVQSEIVEHPDQGLRSVFLFYQGRKCPAKIWITFSETTIAGIHYDVWAEGYAKRKPANAEPTSFEKFAKHPITWWIGSVLGIVIIIFCWYYGIHYSVEDWG